MQIDMTKRKTYIGDVFDALLGRGWAIQEAVDFCDRLPTIDAVEVVRCKDCEYYVLHALACRHEHMNGVMPIDGFCSNGKRRSHHDSLCDQTEEETT